MSEIIPFNVLTLLSTSSPPVYSICDCLEDMREGCQNCSVLYSVWQLFTIICSHIWAVLTVDCWFRFKPCCIVFHSSAQWCAHTWALLTANCWFRFTFAFVRFCHFVLVLFAFLVLGLASSVLSQESRWEERL